MSVIPGMPEDERVCGVDLINSGDIEVFIKPGVPVAIVIKTLTSAVVDLILQSAGKEPSKILPPPSGIFTFPGGRG